MDADEVEGEGTQRMILEEDFDAYYTSLASIPWPQLTIEAQSTRPKLSPCVPASRAILYPWVMQASEEPWYRSGENGEGI